MRLVRYGDAGKEKPGILDAQGAIRDLSGVVADIDGSALAPDSLAKLRGLNVDSLPKVSGSPALGVSGRHPEQARRHRVELLGPRQGGESGRFPPSRSSS